MSTGILQQIRCVHVVAKELPLYAPLHILTRYYSPFIPLCSRSEIEAEMARTQKNKATEYHLGRLKMKLAKLKVSLCSQ